jgi:hypothetical protein
MGTTLPISGQEWSLKAQPGYNVVENPKFDSRILNLPMRQVSQGYGGTKDSTLYRGAMVGREDRDNFKYKVNFLYNPSTITESRSIDLNGQVFPDYARVPGDSGDYQTALNTTVSFSLLFDRTYEMWDSKYQTTDVGTFGCSVDVNAFFNLCGINTKQLVPGTRGGKSQQMTVQGPMAAVPMDLYFGYGSPGGLHYFGIVTSLGVTYSHFSQQMVPVRCAVDIGFTVFADRKGS